MRLLVVIALLCVTSAARAETAFLMEPQVEERIAADVRARVLKVAVDALRSEGYTVLPLEQVHKAGATCGDETCVRGAAERLGAQFGVKLTMMASPGADTLGSLGVAFYQRDALVYRAKAVRVLDQGIERAVYEVLRSAREHRQRGPGPWVVVSGNGASVELWLEGKLVHSGGLPAVVKVAPERQHVFTVKRLGSEAEEYTVPVGPDQAASYDLELPENAAPAVATRVGSGVEGPGSHASTPAASDVPEPNAKRVATWKDWALGGSLVAAGGLLAINPLRTLAQRGDCYDDDARDVDGDCKDEAKFGARSGVFLGLGAALVVTGIIVPSAWKPFGRIEVVADRNSAVLRFGGTFGGHP